MERGKTSRFDSWRKGVWPTEIGDSGLTTPIGVSSTAAAGGIATTTPTKRKNYFPTRSSSVAPKTGASTSAT
ncbi:hypothetical protein TIFTF001_047789, partial [Ficus carica]